MFLSMAQNIFTVRARKQKLEKPMFSNSVSVFYLIWETSGYPLFNLAKL